MFDIDAGKFVIVGVIALVFIPPKDLPRVMRQVGQFVGKMRRMASEFQGQFMDAMREADMADLRKEAQKLSDAARVSTGLDTLHDLGHQMTRSLDETPAPAAVGVATAEIADEGAASSPVGAEPHVPASDLAAQARVDPPVEPAREARASADQPA